MYRYDEDVRVDPVVELGLHPDVRCVQASSPAELRPLFREIEDWMRVLGYARIDIFSVTLALLEVATNAFLHGNKGDPGKHVRVRYLVAPTEVLLEVEDEGVGFDPAREQDSLTGGDGGRPVGRGLFVTRACTSWVSFNARGNRVTLCRRRSTPGPVRPL
jgi:anti-sigma regulatory factor (Ser/Thr protein kinase)